MEVRGYALELKANIAMRDDGSEFMFILTITGMPNHEEAKAVSDWVQRSLKGNMQGLGEVSDEIVGHA